MWVRSADWIMLYRNAVSFTRAAAAVCCIWERQGFAWKRDIGRIAICTLYVLISQVHFGHKSSGTWWHNNYSDFNHFQQGAGASIVYVKPFIGNYYVSKTILSKNIPHSNRNQFTSSFRIKSHRLSRVMCVIYHSQLLSTPLSCPAIKSVHRRNQWTVLFLIYCPPPHSMNLS